MARCRTFALPVSVPLVEPWHSGATETGPSDLLRIASLTIAFSSSAKGNARSPITSGTLWIDIG